MATVDDLKARVSDASTVARCRLEDRISRSEEQQDEVLREVVSHVITDKLVTPQSLDFAWMYEQLRKKSELRVRFGSEAVMHDIHNHALGQMADVAGLTRTYMRRLHDSEELWMHSLLSHNFNELFGQGRFVDRRGRPKRFLVRLMRSHIRGFLSQNYNRKLSTAPLLRSFIEACRAAGAGPVETTATDVRVRVKYMLPYIFEPVDGEFVSFGVTFGNSDYGAGRLSVSGTVMRSGAETLSVLSGKYSRTHLGSIIKDSDIEMSQGTADKELDAVRSAISDTVTQLLGPDSLERHIAAIKRAHQEKIPWYRLKDKLSGLLGKEDLSLLGHMLDGGASVVDLPPVQHEVGEGGASIAVPTVWWAANAVSSLAAGKEDPDRKAELQDMAGQLIAG